MGLFGFFVAIVAVLAGSSKKSNNTKKATTTAQNDKSNSNTTKSPVTAEPVPVQPAEPPAPVFVPQPAELLNASIAKVQTSAERLKSTLGVTQIGAADLNVVAALPTAPAVANALKTTLKTDPRNNASVLQDFTGIDNVDDIFSAIENTDKSIAGLYGQIQKDKRDILGQIENGYPDILKNVIESVSYEATNVINDILKANINIKDEDFRKITALISLGKVSDAADLLVNISDLSKDEITVELAKIRAKASAFLNEQGPTTTPKQIGTKVEEWSEANTTDRYVFEYVETEEELELELKSIKREITEVVVHWTYTANDINIGAEELHDMWKSQRSVGIPFHYIIRRDGRLQRGRPIEELFPENEVQNNHHLNSIHIAFVAGYNAPFGTPNIETMASPDSILSIQHESLDHFIHMFYRAFPGGQVLGHNDIDRDEIDPGYDVKAYVETHFGRRNIFDDTFTQQPFSIAQLITKKVNNG